MQKHASDASRMSYFKNPVDRHIDSVHLVWEQTSLSDLLWSDLQDVRPTCLGQTEVAVDWSAVTSGHPHRWDSLRCVLQRQEDHSVELEERKVCSGLCSKIRVNSDVFLFCCLSQSAGWWNRSPMAVFLPCRAAALPAVVDTQEGASPLVPAAQVCLFRPDCCLIVAWSF